MSIHKSFCVGKKQLSPDVERHGGEDAGGIPGVVELLLQEEVLDDKGGGGGAGGAEELAEDVGL